MIYTYKYPRPALTADCVIFGFDGHSLKLLLIERGIEPFLGMWALPGGFMQENESIEECARRELREETNLSGVYMEQFRTFSNPRRDPRGRVVTVVFIALVRPADYRVISGDDASNAAWFDADTLPPLAFDHAEIIRLARERLKEILRLRPAAFRLIDECFSVDDLRKVYEAVNRTTYDRRNFQRKLMQADIVEPIRDNEEQVCNTYNFSEESTPLCQSVRQHRRSGIKYSLKKLFGSKNSDDDFSDLNASEEGSTKDLFNF